MILSSISLENFRSYTKNEFGFEPQGSLIIGQNGCGKTNLLEAVAYTGIGKSIRFHHDEELLTIGAPYFRVASGFITDNDNSLQVALSFGSGKKLLKLDGLPIRQLSRLFDLVKVIYAAPEDLMLVNGAPRFRRQYFDLAISQLYPSYIPVLRNYLHIVEQRNVLLKRKFEDGEKRSWDSRFAQTLHEVLSYRKRYLELVNEAYVSQFQDVFPQAAKIKIVYESVLKLKFDAEVSSIVAAVNVLESREKLWQRSLAGAHLDDYTFFFEQHQMKTFASQGQKRIAVIILKLIQAQLIETVTKIKPVLLFDDIFAELDINHCTSIKMCINCRYQLFIASPKEDITRIWDGFPVLRMNGDRQ